MKINFKGIWTIGKYCTGKLRIIRLKIIYIILTRDIGVYRASAVFEHTTHVKAIYLYLGLNRLTQTRVHRQERKHS